MATVVDNKEESAADVSNVEEALKPPPEPEQPQADTESPGRDPNWSKLSNEELQDLLANSQQMIGKQSNDVGAARQEAQKLRAELDAIKTADRYLQGQLGNVQQQKPEEKLDYFGDPAKAIKQEIASSSELQTMQRELEEIRVENIRRELLSAHPDFKEVWSSPEFETWVASSPSRTASFKAMNTSYNVEIAKELLSEYKATKQTQAPQPDRKQSVLAASTGSATGSSEKPMGKKLRASDLRELLIKNPDRYQELYPEIRKAYEEGRVINN